MTMPSMSDYITWLMGIMVLLATRELRVIVLENYGPTISTFIIMFEFECSRKVREFDYPLAW